MTNDNTAARYLAETKNAAYIVFARADRADDRAAAYHRKLYTAAALCEQAHACEGVEGVHRLQLDLVASDADGTVLAEVRRLLRCVQVRD